MLVLHSQERSILPVVPVKTVASVCNALELLQVLWRPASDIAIDQLVSAILCPLYRPAFPPAAGCSTGGWIGETTPDSAAYATGTAGPRSIPPIGSTFVRINGLRFSPSCRNLSHGESLFILGEHPHVSSC